MARFIITGEYKDKATQDARKDLKRLGKETSAFGKIAKKYWGIAAAAASYYAQKALRSSMRAAMEDEKSQKQLALTLGTVAGASEAATIAAEANIKSMSMLFGIADDELRPAMSRLARVTGSASQAASDLDLALTLATATGASLEQATNAISKAYAGNYKTLKSLGLSLDDNLVKNKQTSKILKQLKTQYSDLARNQLETTAVKFNRIKVAAGEATEAIGTELINAVDRLINRQGKIEGVGKSLQDTGDYVADLIGGTSILANQASTSGLTRFLQTISKYTNLAPMGGDRRTGLQDIKKTLDAIKNVNTQEKIRLGLIKSRTAQIRSARYEEELAKKKAKEQVDDTVEGSKKTLEQLMAEEAARKAGFKLTEDIDSIQTVAAAKRLEESRQYKASVIDAAQAQFEAIKRNYEMLSSTWEVQKSAFDVFLAYLKSKSITIPVNFTGGALPIPGSTPSLAAALPEQGIPSFTGGMGTAAAQGGALALGGQTITINVNAGAIGSEDYLVGVIGDALTKYTRYGNTTAPAGFI